MSDELKRQSYRLLYRWSLFEVLVPIFFLAALYWPGGPLVLDIPHLFEKVFASADFLPLSALILLAISSEIEFRGLESGHLGYLRDGAMVISIIYLFLYGFCKLHYLEYDFPPVGKDVEDNIITIAFFSIGAVFFAVAYATLSKAFLTKAIIRSATAAPGR